MIVQSTAVMALDLRFGSMQDLPTGSGKRETRQSPSKISVQLSLLKVSSETKRALSSLSL
jgi:hypothetical protein